MGIVYKNEYMAFWNVFFGNHSISSLLLLLFQFIRKNVGVREQLSFLYISGVGIEIGALNRPLPLFHRSRATYVDRLSPDDLRIHYPELHSVRLTKPDIIDDGERLEKISDSSCDFVIANHFLEHCEDPILAMKSFLRVLHVNGILYLAVPDKDQTFDRLRKVTSWEHLKQDHISGPGISRSGHYLEFSRYVMSNSDDNCHQVAHDLEMREYSIHFHVWDIGSFQEFLGRICRSEPVDLLTLLHHADEMIAILKKKEFRNQNEESV